MRFEEPCLDPSPLKSVEYALESKEQAQGYPCRQDPAAEQVARLALFLATTMDRSLPFHIRKAWPWRK